MVKRLFYFFGVKLKMSARALGQFTKKKNNLITGTYTGVIVNLPERNGSDIKLPGKTNDGDLLKCCTMLVVGKMIAIDRNL